MRLLVPVCYLHALACWLNSMCKLKEKLVKYARGRISKSSHFINRKKNLKLVGYSTFPHSKLIKKMHSKMQGKPNLIQ